MQDFMKDLQKLLAFFVESSYDRRWKFCRFAAEFSGKFSLYARSGAAGKQETDGLSVPANWSPFRTAAAERSPHCQEMKGI